MEAPRISASNIATVTFDPGYGEELKDVRFVRHDNRIWVVAYDLACLLPYANKTAWHVVQRAPARTRTNVMIPGSTRAWPVVNLTGVHLFLDRVQLDGKRAVRSWVTAAFKKAEQTLDPTAIRPPEWKPDADTTVTQPTLDLESAPAVKRQVWTALEVCANPHEGTAMLLDPNGDIVAELPATEALILARAIQTAAVEAFTAYAEAGAR